MTNIKRERLIEVLKTLTFLESFEIICVGRSCESCPMELLKINCRDFNFNKKEEIIEVC